MALQPWRFLLRIRTLQIWKSFEYPLYRNNDPLLGGEEAARDLKFWFRDDYFATQALREICAKLDLGSRRDPWELLELVGTALVRGQLVAAYEPERVYVCREDEPEEVATPRPTSVPDWIDVRVVWDDSGEPLCGLPIVVQPSRSSYQMRTTDGEGRVHLEPVPAGPCEVRCSFDDLPARACVRLVGTGEVARTDDEKSRAPDRRSLRPQAIVSASTHKVRTGETLEGLARGINLTGQKLAKFNFGTEDPAKVAEHLRDDIGCTQKTAGEHVFDDDDDPGVILLPKKWSQQLEVSRHHVLRVMPVQQPTFDIRVRLVVNPKDAQASDDVFTLIGGRDVRSPKYAQTKTAKDDLLPGDSYCDVVFTGLITGISYWLEVDEGSSGNKYYAFDARSWDTLWAVACNKAG